MNKLLRPPKLTEDSLISNETLLKKKAMLENLLDRLDKECYEKFHEWLKTSDAESPLYYDFLKHYHNIQTAQRELDHVVELLGDNWT